MLVRSWVLKTNFLLQNDDDGSTSSSDSGKSDDPKDEHVMHIVGRLENGVRCITVREEDVVWDDEILL